jgi:hypothetical protein
VLFNTIEVQACATVVPRKDRITNQILNRMRKSLSNKKLSYVERILILMDESLYVRFKLIFGILPMLGLEIRFDNNQTRLETSSYKPTKAKFPTRRQEFFSFRWWSGSESTEA